ncbi:hypothetical protein APHAL10511_008603 [Amanita phalloides]|nr:hypothetical protein APHAL10511_008603 [Amanita phalloides]
MPLPEDQYHHYIPRFILRRFKIPTPPISQQKTNRKGRGQRKQIDSPGTLYYCDLATGALENRSIGKVYGIVNLYKDAKNPKNVHHLEGKLSVLENQAANVIRKIHGALNDGSFQIERRDLDALRKFIQIMCYRIQTSYFDEAHPENVPGAGFFKHLRESKGLDNGIEVWLHFLDYFLNTPHNDIVNRAAEFHEKEGADRIRTMVLSGCSEWPTNATAEDFMADDYNHMADDYYLGVVEAAAGTEFIMSNRAFGLWEGMVDQLPGAHRLFIVSPHIALILRLNFLNDDIPLESPLFVRSSLIDIPLQRAQIHYANGRQIMTVEELLRHRASPAGQRDQVKFKITQLTKQQTQNVNMTILLNVREDGSVTFLSKGIMRKTLEHYMDLSNKFVVETKNRYLPLMDQLADGENPDRHIGIEGRHFNNRSSEIDDSLTRLLESGATISEILSSADDKKNKRLKVLLNDISSGKISCKSDYDRAYQIYQAASTEEEAGRYVLSISRMLQPIVIDTVLISKAEDITSRNSIIQINIFSELVKTLPSNQSAKVMGTIKALFADEPVPPYSDPEISNFLHDAIIVGLLDGLAKECSFVFPVLFPGISLLQ